VLEWTCKNEAASWRQGWGLFDIGEALALQRLDDPASVFGECGMHPASDWVWGEDLAPRFPHDDAAREFVMRQANNGDTLARKALALLRQQAET
jgi:hypothetical protein